MLVKWNSGYGNRGAQSLEDSAYSVLRSMNRNYLLKDELQYEISARVFSSDSDVQTLLKLFRSLVAEKLPVDLRNLNTQSV